MKSLFYILFFILLSFEGFSQINFAPLSGRNGNLVPVLATTAASSITSTAASSGGNITSDGGAIVSARGIVWSTSPNPDIVSPLGITTNGSGTGTFTSSITGLITGTTYYVRSYATNSAGTGYGSQVSFTTLSVPVLDATTIASSITSTSASSGGNVTSDGGASVNTRGIVWSTSPNPDISLSTKTTNGSGTGTFASSITGLISGVTYYVRSYATNSIGTGYGAQVSFTTLSIPILAATTAATSITTVSAISGGNITYDGGLNVTSSGIVWSTSANPDISLSTKTNDGAGNGTFSSNIIGLTSGITYYVRSYATNSLGTGYGAQISFTTLSLPVLAATTTASSITSNSAISGGNVTYDGGANVTTRGVVWSTTANPDISLITKTTDGSGTGTFTSSMTGLTFGTTYYIRSYATNSVGTAYGTQVAVLVVQLGSTYQCGILFYILAPSDPGYSANQVKGLLAAPSDMSTGIRWDVSNAANVSVPIVYTLGAGLTNTNNIITSMVNQGYVTTDYAAIVARNYAGCGYTDWFLPSIDELSKLYLNRNFVPGLDLNHSYWSSSNVDKAYAWFVAFWSSGATSTKSKANTYNVRAVRYISTSPDLTTSTATSITTTSATSGGDIITDGGSSVTARGIVWSTSSNPDVSLSTKTSDGSGTGAFTSSITGLNPGTTYYVRSYATNSFGTGYGVQVSFNTASVPVLSTTAVASITATSATSGGTITSDGGAALTAKGVCWSITANPTIADSKTSDGTASGTFTSSITGLTIGTTYFVRSYATNSVGTGYGDQLSFTVTSSPELGATTAANSITANSVKSGGIITADRGLSVTVRGIVWSTAINPDISLITKTTDGSGNGTFASSITGLTSGTTYYIRSYATNSYGTSYGTQVSFTTLSVPVLAATTVATSITNTKASSGGTVTSDGGAALTAEGVCWSTNTNPTIADNKTSDGTSTGIFTSSITGLTFGTTYYIRSYATNSLGTSYGAQVSFTTSSVPELIGTTAASSITTTSAGSGGNITSDVGSIVTLRGVVWSTAINPDISLSTKTTDGSGTGTFMSNITGLTTGSTYYVRSYATSSSGTGYGTQISFTTLSVPVLATTITATSITGTSASSGGNITSGGGSSVTARGIVWSTSSNPDVSLSTKTTDGSGIGIFASSITGLTTGTTYYVRTYATNGTGTGYGTQVSFTTFGIPVLDATTAVTSITTTSASSGGNVTSNGGSALTAEGICWSTIANPTIADSKTSNSATMGTFVSSITGLTTGTTYYVRSYATNSAGTGYGTQVSFTTLGVPALAATTSAASIAPTSANSGGNITSDGGSSVTARGIVWNTSSTPDVSLSTKTTDGSGIGTFASSMTGLTPGTIYYVRSYATNSTGTGYGAEISFTTYSVPILSATAVVTSITTTSATSGGTVTGNGGYTITSYGICWSTVSDPTIADSKTAFVGSRTAGQSFSGFGITGLTAGTTYYVRSFATNSYGTGYGPQVSFGVPVLDVTTAATSIFTTSANSGGNVISNGGTAITYKGICWSTVANPTIADSKTSISGATLGSFTGSMTGLTLSTTYYVRSYATNLFGTAYGAQISFRTMDYDIGQAALGGKIAYCLQPGDVGFDSNVTHGLVATIADLGSAQWGCELTLISGADGTAIGTGNQNTIDIMAGCATAGIAARLCGDLVQGGYSDWYLPSKDELLILYVNSAAIGGFVNTYYWSSSEVDASNVGTYSIGTYYSKPKNSSRLVRPIRSF